MHGSGRRGTDSVCSWEVGLEKPYNYMRQSQVVASPDLFQHVPPVPLPPFGYCYLYLLAAGDGAGEAILSSLWSVSASSSMAVELSLAAVS